jgi:hypothetical protein
VGQFLPGYPRPREAIDIHSPGARPPDEADDSARAPERTDATPSSIDIGKIDQRIFEHALARTCVGSGRAWGWQGVVLGTFGAGLSRFARPGRFLGE